MGTLTENWWVPLRQVEERGSCTDLQRDEKKPTAKCREDNAQVVPRRMFHFWDESSQFINLITWPAFFWIQHLYSATSKLVLSHKLALATFEDNKIRISSYLCFRTTILYNLLSLPNFWPTADQRHTLLFKPCLSFSLVDPNQHIEYGLI